MKSTAYSFKNVVSVIDGIAVTGFWEGDDAVQVAPAADVGTGLVGADGSSIFSQSTNRAATITIRLQHTSPAHRLLETRYQRQMAGGLTGFPVSVMDTGSNEGGSTDQAFIQRRPNDQKGVNASMREWVLWSGFWTPELPTA